MLMILAADGGSGLARSARQVGAGQAAECRHTALSACKRLPLRSFQGGHPVGATIPCFKSLLQVCQWRTESPRLAPN